MRYHRFGRTGWQMSEIGYGRWDGGWSGSEGTESLAALQLAVDLGCNFFDTAWGYGEGHSEKLLGHLIRANPQKKLFTAMKIPPKNFKWPSRREYSLEECFPPDHIEENVLISLTNAGLDHIDLLQLHTWEDSWLEDDGWLKKIDQLRSQGLFSAIGISLNRWEPWNGVKAVRSGLVDAVQVIYNIFDQNPEDETLPACEEMVVAVIARVPFDEGPLTGNLTLDSTWPTGDWRKTYFVPQNLKSSVAHGDALTPLIPEGMTMPEMALRFILNESRVSTIIPGMRKLPHVRSNLAYSDKDSLPEAAHLNLKKHRWDWLPKEWSQ